MGGSRIRTRDLQSGLAKENVVFDYLKANHFQVKILNVVFDFLQKKIC